MEVPLLSNLCKPTASYGYYMRNTLYRTCDMRIEMEPIGFIRTDAEQIPRHWTISNVEGDLYVEEKYLDGLKDIKADQQIMVIFLFHKSQAFTPQFLVQQPWHKDKKLGVFSICSPLRPNPIGISVVKVLKIDRNILKIKGIDMLDGTPVLDIKPYVTDRKS